MFDQAIEVTVGLGQMLKVLIAPQAFQAMVHRGIQCLGNDLVGDRSGDLFLFEDAPHAPSGLLCQRSAVAHLHRHGVQVLGEPTLMKEVRRRGSTGSILPHRGE